MRKQTQECTTCLWMLIVSCMALNGKIMYIYAKGNLNYIPCTSREEESYSEYASYASRCHTQLLRERWTYYRHSILENLMKTKVSSLVIADFGTCDGGNSITLFLNIIEFLKSKEFSCDVTFVFNDLPANDFNVLNKKVKALKRAGSSVHILMSACNMYDRCLPIETLDLGCSTYATQFLSRGTVETGVGYYTTTDLERQVMKDQAALDWKQFLVHRYEEMKTDGYLVIRFVDGGQPYREAVEFAFMDLFNHGFLTKDELYNINLPVYIRNEDEIRAPFEDGTLNLRLVDVHRSEVPHLTDKDKVIESALPWIKKLLLSGLSPDRNESYVDKTSIELFRTIKERSKYLDVKMNSVIEVVVHKTE